MHISTAVGLSIWLDHAPKFDIKQICHRLTKSLNPIFKTALMSFHYPRGEASLNAKYLSTPTLSLILHAKSNVVCRRNVN